MARRLPPPPARGAATNDYLTRLVRELESQLDRKADLIDGRVYATDEQPVMVLDAEGNKLRLGQDVIPPMQPAGDYVPLSGGGINGNWVKFADGTIVQRIKRFTLPYYDISRCTAIWTFPKAFIDAEYSLSIALVTPTDTDNAFAFASNAAPTVQEISNTGAGMLSETSVQVTVERVIGLTDFAPGDKMYASITAWGRWKL